MFRLRWGSYYFRLASANIAIARNPILNTANVPFQFEETWTITGRLKNPGSTDRDMDPVIRNFEFALGFRDQDLTLERDDGSGTSHALYSRDCIGGTFVSQYPSFPTGSRGEYVTYRSFTFAIAGIKVAPSPGHQYTQWSERIQIRGGGFKRGVQEVNFGPGISQRYRTHSKCVAVQSGSAVGYYTKPDVPPPIWPAALTDEYPDLDLGNPTLFGDGINSRTVDHSTNWTYNYEWPFRLFGEPHFLIG